MPRYIMEGSVRLTEEMRVSFLSAVMFRQFVSLPLLFCAQRHYCDCRSEVIPQNPYAVRGGHEDCKIYVYIIRELFDMDTRLTYYSAL
jgi:hypothetical protein